MSLAAEISHQLNGRKSGNSFSIPAICHSPDTTKYNLQISDGGNGKLWATCHSNHCDYKTIMQALEECGAKPRDLLIPEHGKIQKAKKSRLQLSKALWHELHVLMWYMDKRMCDPAKLSDPMYLEMNPNYKPMKPELEPREQQALIRINKITGEII